MVLLLRKKRTSSSQLQSDILKNTLKIHLFYLTLFLSDNLKMICRRSVTSNVDAQICHDSSFPTQFRLFTETNQMFLSNWTPWYNPKHETIHLYSFQQSPGYAGYAGLCRAITGLCRAMQVEFSFGRL